MNDKQRAEMERRLQGERDKALKAIHQVEEDEDPAEAGVRDESRFHTHMADQGSDAEGSERDFMIAAMESDLVTKIDEALELLISEPDRFAKCDSCGEEIQWERFELLPWTRLCARCASREESGTA